MCDWNRIVSTCGIVFRPILLSAPSAEKALPMRLPDLMGQAGMARWPVCFEPQVRMLVLARGGH
jgi:hypothetical protein